MTRSGARLPERPYLVVYYWLVIEHVDRQRTDLLKLSTVLQNSDTEHACGKVHACFLGSKDVGSWLISFG